MKFVFKTDAADHVIAFATTNKSHPRGAMVDDRPILVTTKRPR